MEALEVAPEETDVNFEPVPSLHQAACEPHEAMFLDYLTDIPVGAADDEEAVELPMIPVEITWVATKVCLTLRNVNRPG